MTVTFDEQWNPEDDPYAVILAPAEPSRAYEPRQPTLDDLLDLRNEMTDEINRLNRDDDARIGVSRARNMLDTLLASL